MCWIANLSVFLSLHGLDFASDMQLNENDPPLKKKEVLSVELNWLMY